MLVLMVLMILCPTIALAQTADIHRQARCLAGCATKYVANPSIERMLLSGKSIYERNETVESYQLCSVGCQKPIFGKGIASLREGISIYQETGVRTNRGLPPLADRVDIVCAESLEKSTKIHLALNLVDERDSTAFVCAADIWQKSVMGLEKSVLTVYSLNSRFALTHTFVVGSLYQFRINCYSFEGQRGHEIRSNWLPQKHLVPSNEPLSVSLDSQNYVNGYVASHLSWRAPSESLVSCQQRLVLISNNREIRDLVLDDSSQIEIGNMMFATTYLIKVLPSTSQETDRRGLTVRTKSCLEIADASAFCDPPLVKEVFWLFDGNDRLFIGWTYNTTAVTNELHFFISLNYNEKANGNPHILERIVGGDERSVLFELPATEGELEASIIVVDARNKRSPRWSSRLRRNDKNVDDNEWLLKLGVLVGSLSIVLLVVAVVVMCICMRYFRRDQKQTSEVQTVFSTPQSNHTYALVSPFIRRTPYPRTSRSRQARKVELDRSSSPDYAYISTSTSQRPDADCIFPIVSSPESLSIKY